MLNPLRSLQGISSLVKEQFILPSTCSDNKQFNETLKNDDLTFRLFTKEIQENELSLSKTILSEALTQGNGSKFGMVQSKNPSSCIFFLLQPLLFDSGHTTDTSFDFFYRFFIEINAFIVLCPERLLLVTVSRFVEPGTYPVSLCPECE